MKSKQIGKEKADSSFAELLEASMDGGQTTRPGTPVQARIASTRDKDFIFVNTHLGAGVIPKAQLLDQDNRVTVNPGETIQAYVLSRENGELHLTLFPSGKAQKAILEHSLQEKLPVQGTIQRKIKGGYEVVLGEASAFCPMSQMEGDPAPGSILSFLVIELSDRKVVVSNRSFREMEKERQKEILQHELEEGAVIQGTVTNLLDFGAFVDIGGMEGLIPLSELSYKRIRHPSEVVKSGQSIRVKVLSIDWKEERITLSLKSLLENPWQGQMPFAPGDIVEATVESIKNFGVFARLPDGFSGLIPMSETGLPRGVAADREFHRGEELRLMILDVDRQREKISLSLRRVQDADARKEYEQYMQENQPQEKEEVSSFGKALLASLNQNDKN